MYLFTAQYLMPHPDAEGKQQRTTCSIVAENFQAALLYFARDLQDQSLEFEAIVRGEPVVTVFETPPPAATNDKV